MVPWTTMTERETFECDGNKKIKYEKEKWKGNGREEKKCRPTNGFHFVRPTPAPMSMTPGPSFTTAPLHLAITKARSSGIDSEAALIKFDSTVVIRRKPIHPLPSRRNWVGRGFSLKTDSSWKNRSNLQKRERIWTWKGCRHCLSTGFHVGNLSP